MLFEMIPSQKDPNNQKVSIFIANLKIMFFYLFPGTNGLGQEKEFRAHDQPDGRNFFNFR